MSTPDTFRDALARAYDGPDGPFAHSTADAVLASDEMQAVRRTLERIADRMIYRDNWGNSAEVLTNYGLPDHLIAWVLDDPSPDSPAPCVCGEVVIQGGTVELAGVKHRTDGPCYHCAAYDNEITESPDSPADMPCPDCYGKGLEGQDDRPGLLLPAAECRSCRGSGRVPADKPCETCGGDGWAACSDPSCNEWRCIPCPSCRGGEQ